MNSNTYSHKLEQQSDLTFKCAVEENGSTSARPTLPSGKRNTLLDVWNQIRRTEEDPIEMGTMDNTLLLDQGAVAEGLVSAVEKLTKIGA
jgi:hypothetical protein